MSGAPDTGEPSDTYRLSKKQLDAFLHLARPRTFKAGEWIATPGRPLLGWYLIESGAVATADDAVADLARRGLILERHDMFGEYSLVPGEKPFPSVLRALTEVGTQFLKAEIYPGLAQREPAVDDLVKDRVTLNKHLASFVAALKRYRPLEKVPPYQLIKIAQRGQVSTYDKEQLLDVTQSNKGIVFVASGELTMDESVVLQAGSIFRPVERTGRRQVTKGTCLIDLHWAAIRDSVPNYVRLATAMESTNNPAPPVAPPDPCLPPVPLPRRPRPDPVMVRLASDAKDTPISGLCVLLAETLQRDQPRRNGKTEPDDAFTAVVLRVYPDPPSLDEQESDKAVHQRLALVGGGVVSAERSGLPNLWKNEGWKSEIWKSETWRSQNVPDVALIDDTPCRRPAAVTDLNRDRDLDRDLNRDLKPSKLLYFVRDSWELPRG